MVDHALFEGRAAAAPRGGASTSSALPGRGSGGSAVSTLGALPSGVVGVGAGAGGARGSTPPRSVVGSSVRSGGPGSGVGRRAGR